MTGGAAGGRGGAAGAAKGDAAGDAAGAARAGRGKSAGRVGWASMAAKSVAGVKPDEDSKGRAEDSGGAAALRALAEGGSAGAPADMARMRRSSSALARRLPLSVSFLS